MSLSFPYPLTITNPTAETGDTSGWTNEAGTLIVRASDTGVTPRSGEYYFCSGSSGSDNVAYQDILIPQEVLDEGLSSLRARFTTYHCTYSSGGDIGQMVVQAIGEGDTLLSSIASAPWNPLAVWTEESLELPLPENTIKIRIKLRGIRRRGTQNSCYWDDLSLNLVKDEITFISPYVLDVKNPGGEIFGGDDTPPNWFCSENQLLSVTSQGGVFPRSGTRFLFPGAYSVDLKLTIYQELLLPKCFWEDVDAGNISALFSLWQAGYTDSDHAALSILPVDLQGMALGEPTVSSSETRGATWEQRSLQSKLPPYTRRLQIGMVCSRGTVVGYNLDAYFDDIEASLVKDISAQVTQQYVEVAALNPPGNANISAQVTQQYVEVAVLYPPNTLIVSDFCNGFDLPGDTYLGGPTQVEDYQGTLVTSPVSVMPIEGMRLSEGIWHATDPSGQELYSPTVINTLKGPARIFHESYRGPLLEPDRRNYFVQATSPATQEISVSQYTYYTVSVLGPGSLELSGAFTATVTQDTPQTFRPASTGMLLCTVVGELTRVQVENSQVATSWIDTLSSAVSRPAGKLTRATEGTSLAQGNDFVIYGRVYPRKGNGENNRNIFSLQYSWQLYIEAITASSLKVRKVGSTYLTLPTSKFVVPEGLFEYQYYQSSTYGAGLRARSYTEGAWSAWSEWEVLLGEEGTAFVDISPIYQIGGNNFYKAMEASYPFTQILDIPSGVDPQQYLTWGYATSGASEDPAPFLYLGAQPVIRLYLGATPLQNVKNFLSV